MGKKVKFKTRLACVYVCVCVYPYMCGCFSRIWLIKKPCNIINIYICMYILTFTCRCKQVNYAFPTLHSWSKLKHVLTPTTPLPHSEIYHLPI